MYALHALCYLYLGLNNRFFRIIETFHVIRSGGCSSDYLVIDQKQDYVLGRTSSESTR
jgi:hypothetical protein